MGIRAVMVGYAEDDLQSIFKKIQGTSGATYTTIHEPPPKKDEKVSRSYGTIANTQEGDSLFIIAHGNGEEWGSSDSTVGISQSDMVDFMARTVSDGAMVFLCICDSIGGGKSLKKLRPEIRVWAADGTPELSWTGSGISDSTGKFKECK